MGVRKMGAENGCCLWATGTADALRSGFAFASVVTLTVCLPHARGEQPCHHGENMQLAKHDVSWAIRRLPYKVSELLRKHPDTVFLAGGFIRSIIAGEPVNDIDLFTPSKELAKDYCEEIKAKDENIFETENALSIKVGKIQVQFITRWLYDDPAQLIKSFDFTIAKSIIWFGRCPVLGDMRWMSLCDDDFYPDLAGKRLVYTSPDRNEDAGGSMLRVLKFYHRGYRIPLDSLGAVIARLDRGVDRAKFESSCGQGAKPEGQYARVVTGLLREVDPNVGVDHIAYLPGIE